MKNTGFGYDHFTLTVWQSEEDMRGFSQSGAHLNAMRSSKKLAKEIRTLTYHSNHIPTWAEVRKLLSEKPGKILTF